MKIISSLKVCMVSIIITHGFWETKGSLICQDTVYRVIINQYRVSGRKNYNNRHSNSNEKLISKGCLCIFTDDVLKN